MNMTHYMELLAVNQPWNLIIFMAIPIVLAETLAITELYLLFTRKFDGAIFLPQSLFWDSCGYLLCRHHLLHRDERHHSHYKCGRVENSD